VHNMAGPGPGPSASRRRKSLSRFRFRTDCSVSLETLEAVDLRDLVGRLHC
jgi:hypothetical protein